MAARAKCKSIHLFLLAMSIFLPTLVLAGDRYEMSVLISGPGFQDNVIYSVDTKLKTLVPYSYRLANALPQGVKATGLSYGFDGTDTGSPHGLLMFSMGENNSTSNYGQINSALYWEPQGEIQADVYGVEHKPSDAKSLNIKVVEEDTSNLPPPTNAYLPVISFFLPAGSTASVVGVDAHVAPNTGRIYFAVDSNSGGLNTSSIYYLDSQNQVNLWADNSALSLAALDEIDGLSVCMNPNPGAKKCCLFSIKNNSSTTPTTLTHFNSSGPQVPLTGSDIAISYFTGQGTAMSTHIWRSAQANGILNHDFPEIDGVVSVDPKLFRPGSKLSNSSTTPVAFNPIFELTDPTILRLHPDSSTSAIENEVLASMTILWDFSIANAMGSDSHTIAEELRYADQKPLELFYLNEGFPEASFFNVSKNPSLFTNYIDDVGFRSSFGTSTNHSYTSYDFNLDRNYPLSHPDLAVEISYSAGRRVVARADRIDTRGAGRVHWTGTSLEIPTSRPTVLEFSSVIEGTSGALLQRGETSNHVIWPQSPIDPPSDLKVKWLTHSKIELDWTPGATAGSTTVVEIDGGIVGGSPTQLSYEGAPPQEFVLADNSGARHIRLLSKLDSGSGPVVYSTPLKDMLFKGVTDQLKFVRAVSTDIDTTFFPPLDLAWDSSTGKVFMTSTLGGNAIFSRWHVENTSLGEDNYIEPHVVLPMAAGSASYNMHGVATFKGTASDGGQINQLVYLADQNGTTKLLLANVDAPEIVLAECELNLPFQNLTSGALCFDGTIDRMILIANQKAYYLDNATAVFGSSLQIPLPIATLTEMQISAVSVRAAGYYDVTASEGFQGHSHLITLDSDHKVYSALELETVGDIYGFVHTRDPLSMTYISTATGIEVFERPQGLGIIEVNPFNNLGIPYDLDGDGTPFTYLDLVTLANAAGFFAAVDWEDPGATPGALLAYNNFMDGLLNKSTFDVYGGGTTFPGDGQITLLDFYFLAEAYTSSSLPSPSRVPLHPALRP